MLFSILLVDVFPEKSEDPMVVELKTVVRFRDDPVLLAFMAVLFSVMLPLNME